MPSEKEQKRLKALLDAFDSGAVQPDELMKAIDAVMSVIDSNGKALVDTMMSNKAASDKDIEKVKSDIQAAKNNLTALIVEVENGAETSLEKVKSSLLAEIKSVKESIPELPPETDLSEVFEHIEEMRGGMDMMSKLIVGENIRNALETLQGEDRLDRSAIRGLDDYEEVREMAKEKGSGAKGWASSIAKIQAGTNITIDESDPRRPVINATGGGSSTFLDLTDTPSDYTGQAGKVAAVNGTEDGIEFVEVAGTGTVTSVAISGSDGIEVDSGSPITAAGTIALGLNKTNTLTFLNVEDGAEVNVVDSVADTAEIDLDVTARQLTASIVAGSIDESKLDASVNASLDKADSASQPGHTHTASEITDFDTEVSNNTDVAANTSARHAAVTVLDSSEIDFTLTGQQITASLIAGSIDETKLDASVNASLDLADSASQPGHTHSLSAITDVTASAAEVNILDGATLSTTELNYVDGVTSAIQTQLDGKLATTALSDTAYGAGWNADTTHAPTKNAVYDEMELRAPKASPTFTGTVTLPTGLTGVLRADSGVVSTDSDVTDLVTAASDTTAGKVELATAAETTTGTDATRAITPDGLAGSEFGKRTVAVLLSGSASGDTALATGDGLAAFPIDSTLNGMNLVAVKAYVTTVSSSGAPLFQVRRSRRSSATARTIVDMLSTGVSIDANEFESADATTAVSINGSNDDVQTGDILLFDCDTAGTGTKGAQLLLTFALP